MKQRILELWTARNARERAVIGGGSLLLLVGLLYAYVWMPMRSGLQTLERQVPQLRTSAAHMQRDAAEVLRLKGQQPAPLAGGLIGAVQQSAETQGLRDKLGDISSPDSTHVRLSGASVPFDAWITWLGQLQTQFGIRVETASVESLPESGRVKVQAVLWAPGR